MDLSDLQDIERKERETTALFPVPTDFYIKLRALMKSKKEGIDPNDTLSIREYESILMLSKRLIEKRISKIVYHASRGLEAANMTPEENQLYISVSSSSKALRYLVEDVKPSEPIREKEQKEEVQRKENTRRVRISKYVDPYRGLDGKEYGPFNVGTVVPGLPDDEIAWLVENGYAEEV